jgi:dTDP-4-amino-4,6-dideoxygalactose transaminase
MNTQNASVPPLDLKRQFGPIREEILSTLTRVVDSGNFILGSDVNALESEMTAYTQAKYALGVTSGTDALWLALKAFNIGRGDKVLTSPFTFFATVSAIMNTGATPIFCDIEPRSFNIDPNAVAKALEKDTERKIKAIIPVHLYGQSADMEPLLAVAHKYGVKVIEDAAQAIGTKYNGKHVGGIGDIGCFSFFPTKNLGAMGDAGLVTTNDPELASTLKMLRTHGSKTKYYHEIIGNNCRIDTMQAAILRVFLPHLNSWIQSRQETAAYYDKELAQFSDALQTPYRAPYSNHAYHQYTLTVLNGRRNELKDFLTAKKVSCTVYYPVPCHLQNALKQLEYAKGSFPLAEKAADEALSIPIFPGMTHNERASVVAAITEWATKR